ncbi:hypothetical protein [Natronospora cellulosivora (SeqCode)]
MKKIRLKSTCTVLLLFSLLLLLSTAIQACSSCPESDLLEVEERLLNDFEKAKNTVVEGKIELDDGTIVPVTYTMYKPAVKLQYKYDKLSDVSWDKPEFVILSDNSRASEEWDDKNWWREDGVGSVFKFCEEAWKRIELRNQRIHKNYMIVISRLDFMLEETPYVIFKTIGFYEDSPYEVRITRLLRLVEDRWRIIGWNDTTVQISNIITPIRTVFIPEILEGSFYCVSEVLNNAYQRAYYNGILEVNTFTEVLTEQWLNDDDDVKALLNQFYNEEYNRETSITFDEFYEELTRLREQYEKNTGEALEKFKFKGSVESEL